MRVTRRGAAAAGLALAIGVPTAGCSAGIGAPGSAGTSASAEQAPWIGQLPPDLRAAGAVVLGAYQAGQKPGSGEQSFTGSTAVFGPHTVTTLFKAATAGEKVYTYFSSSSPNATSRVDTLTGFGAEVQGPEVDVPGGGAIMPDVAIFSKYDQRDHKWQTIGISVAGTADHQIRTEEIIVTGTGSACYGERTVAPDESFAPVCDRQLPVAEVDKELASLAADMEEIANLRPGSQSSHELKIPILV